MFCPKCGMQNADGAGFCGRCGAPLTAANPNAARPAQPAAPVQPQVQPVPAPAPVQPAQQVPRSSHPVLNEVKTLGASPLFLVAVIALSASLLFNLIQLFTGNTFIVNWTIGILGLEDLYSSSSSFLGSMVSYAMGELFEVLEVVDVVATVFGVIGLIPTILMAVGLWLTWAAANDRTSGGMRTNGLSMVKIGAIVKIVTTLIGNGVMAIFALVMAVACGESYYFEDATPMFVFMMLALLAGIAVTIVYAILIVKSAKAVQDTANTGVPSNKVSAVLPVFLFIMALVNLIMMFIAAGGFVGVVTTLALVASYVLLGIVLMNYRTKMLALMPAYAPQQPVYARPVAQPMQQAVPVQQPVQVAVPAQPVAAPAKVFCAHCGQPGTADQVVCPNCGTPRK